MQIQIAAADKQRCVQRVPMSYVERIFDTLFQLLDTILRRGVSGKSRMSSVGERLPVVHYAIGGQFGMFSPADQLIVTAVCKRFSLLCRAEPVAKMLPEPYDIGCHLSES